LLFSYKSKPFIDRIGFYPIKGGFITPGSFFITIFSNESSFFKTYFFSSDLSEAGYLLLSDGISSWLEYLLLSSVYT
jgi:hypothetical protein